MKTISNNYAAILFNDNGVFTLDHVRETIGEVRQLIDKFPNKHKDKPHVFIVKAMAKSDLKDRKIIHAPKQYREFTGKTVRMVQNFILRQSQPSGLVVS